MTARVVCPTVHQALHKQRLRKMASANFPPTTASKRHQELPFKHGYLTEVVDYQ